MMRQPRSCMQRLLMAFAILLTLVVCAFTVFAIIADSTRDATRAQYRPSEVMEQYKAWSRPLEDSTTVGNVESSSPTPPRPASFDSFAKAREAYKHITGEKTAWDEFIARISKNDAWPDGPDLEQARVLCVSSQDIINEIRAIAAAGGPLVPLDFSNGFDMDLSHLSEVRGMGRILWVDAVSQARDGANDEALEDILSIMRLGDAIAREPMLISQMVRIALYKMACETLTIAFAPGVLTPEQSNRVIAQARQGIHRDSFVEGFRGELSVGLSMFEQMRNGEIPFGIRPDEGWQGLLFQVITSGPARPWLNMDESSCLETMNTLVSLAGKPYFEAASGLSTLETQIENLPFTRVITRLMTPGIANVLQAQARHETELGLLETGLVAEREAMATGAAPTSIAFAGAAAIDPFTGKLFIYKPNGDSFTLYSVGANQIDDGGVHNLKTGDTVWRGK